MSEQKFDDAVEKNIMKLFKTFHDKTAYFLSERDVQSYLYSLLINDAILKISPTIENFSTPNIETPETLLVHTDLQVEVRYMKGTKKVDITILPPKKVIDYSALLDNAIGIEIKFNRKGPARKEPSSILDDVKKCAGYRQGYVLWLNWDRPISDDHLKKTESFLKRHENVKLYYLDLFSDPIKTNINL
jgi:hypothetical protein